MKLSFPWTWAVSTDWAEMMHFRRIGVEPEPTAKEQSRDKMSHAAVKNETLMALGKRRLSNSKEGRGGRQGLKLKRLWRFYKSSYKNWEVPVTTYLLSKSFHMQFGKTRFLGAFPASEKLVYISQTCKKYVILFK